MCVVRSLRRDDQPERLPALAEAIQKVVEQLTVRHLRKLVEDEKRRADGVPLPSICRHSLIERAAAGAV
jgi:hypothetical protein